MWFWGRAPGQGGSWTAADEAVEELSPQAGEQRRWVVRSPAWEMRPLLFVEYVDGRRALVAALRAHE